MIPVKLQLRNFMSYRGSDNTIDFSGIHLACLSGDNGMGKSTLLDAMTWALWGKARARRDDDLITHGESETEVQFEFELSSERYRVVRKRNSSGRGSSVLELQGRTGSGFFASLSEPTIRESQQRINNLLKLDYDTFVNSSFLLQGRADEFTTKKPAERKQILADILGLAEYDVYAERAKERARAAEEQRQHAERELERIREIVAEIPTIELELIDAEVAVSELMHELLQANEAFQALLDQRRELDAKAEARVQAELRAKEGRGEIIKLQTRVDEQRARLARFDALLARAEEIEGAMARLGQARIEKDHWDDLLQRSLQLQNEASTIQAVIEKARSQVSGDLRVTEAQMRSCRQTLDRFSSRERELAEAEKQVQLLVKVQAEREQHQRTLAEEMEKGGQLRAENKQLLAQMTTIKERMALLDGTEAAECPICRQPLSAEARAQAHEEAQAEGTALGDHYRDNRAQMKQAEETIASLHASVESADRQLKELAKWQRRQAEAAQAAEEMQRARRELQEAEQQARVLNARLEAGDYAREEQARLAELASVSDSLGYDRAQHEAAKRTIQELSPRQQEANDLALAREQRASTVEAMQALEELARTWQERVTAAEREMHALAMELQQREEVLRRVHEQQVLVNSLQKEKSIADRRFGGAKQRLEFAEQHAARQPEVEASCHAAVEQRTIYDQLAQAFGKRGVQAMIIEAALPDLEEAANRLLRRMTDGRMSVALQTQREARTTDGMIETLDILIADEYGERPYEMFSGGEAFRVNFALRIALSKLLAHRAGTSLRTLVMDEGFGSQDAMGRERLVEAITSVQDDFDRILVITHIEELKDAFPTRIEVSKGVNGSKVRVR
ncbi:MAG TPA: SMC family ATPase [Ardenticatenaceae bacterium]|jgi:exonuclease SbcC